MGMVKVLSAAGYTVESQNYWSGRRVARSS
jgi:hypothetical protein